MKNEAPLAFWAQVLIQLIEKIGLFRTVISVFLGVVSIQSCLIFAATFLIFNQFDSNIFFSALLPISLFTSVIVGPFVYLASRLGQLQKGKMDFVKQEKMLNQSFMENIRRLNFEIEERKKRLMRNDVLSMNFEKEMNLRKQAQQEFQEQSILLTSIQNSSPDLFYYRDMNGRFAGCNKMFEEVVGKPKEELIGKFVSDLYVEDQVSSTLVAEDTEESEATYDVDIVMPNGELHWFEMRKKPFYDANDSLIGVLSFGRDITARKQAEQALEKAYGDKGKFIATLSHELRTPLNGIVGLSRMLLDSDLDKSQRSWANTIFSSAETLGNIFNDIIDLDKIDRNEVDIVLDAVFLSDFLNDMVNFGSLICQQKTLSFDFATSGNLDQHVTIDKTRVRQVIWNLLNNAVKFTKTGGIEFKLDFYQGSSGAEMVFTIKDSGIGISEQDLARIFEMYYKVPDGRRINAMGSGIGLAVSKALVEAMGGSLAVESEVNVGSTFTVSIPVSIAVAPQEKKYSGRCLNVLLVEDVPLNAQIAKNILEQRGHETIWAEDGAEALALLETEDDIDLILLDMQLPDTTGDVLARQIRADKDLQHHIIIVVTANVRKASEQLEGIDIQGTLGKPINTQQLDALLNQFFGSAISEGPTPSTACLIEDIDQMQDDYPVLNLPAISDFLSSVGTDPFKQGIELFEKLYPDYINNMLTALKEGDLDEFKSAAHKLKGAAGSVGLKSIQQASSDYEHTESSDIQSLIASVTTFKQTAAEDLKVLNAFIDTLVCA